MSLILDALRRADRERKLGRTPDLKAVYEEDTVPAGNRLGHLLWVCVALVVGAVIVALALWPRGEDHEKPLLPAENQTATLDPTAPEVAVPKTAPFPSTAQGKKGSPVPTPRKSPGESKPAGTGEETRENGAHQGVKSPQTVNSPPGSERTPATGKTASRDLTPPQGPKKADLLKTPSPFGSNAKTASRKPGFSQQDGKKVEVTPKPLNASPPVTTPPARMEKEIQSRRTKDVPLLAGLGPEIREKVGKIEINIHSYSRNPAERLVFINMHKYREGERIGEKGPVLKEITPEGVIIDYGGGEARVNVWR